MVRIHLNIDGKQESELSKLEGNRSEHIRRAIDDYLQKQKNFNVAISLSKPNGK